VADGDWRGYVRVRDESVQTSQLTEKSLTLDDAPGLEKLPLNKEELAVLDYLSKNPRITLAQYMKLLNIGQRRAHRTLIKLTLHGYIKHHDKQKEVY
jgi:predicted HTH transcriptional regulator